MKEPRLIKVPDDGESSCKGCFYQHKECAHKRPECVIEQIIWVPETPSALLQGDAYDLD
jgi:hypothetical protein